MVFGIGQFLKKIFGTKHEKAIKEMQPFVGEINVLYEKYKNLSKEELQAKTEEFKDRINEACKEVREGIEEVKEELKIVETAEEHQELLNELGELEDDEKDIIKKILDEIMVDAFAVVKAACYRMTELGKEGEKIRVRGHEIVWEMIPFDVQLIGAVVLHRGQIAEMATGEGKTLVAAMPLYLNALPGKGVHLITVNDYLANRDSEWIGALFRFLGLTVGCIQSEMAPDLRKEQYAKDITYGTNSEFGFDYLRDNMVADIENRVQRNFHYAIIDEVDSVLIDEARTPLIISGIVERETSHHYDEISSPVRNMVLQQKQKIRKLMKEATELLSTELKENEFEAGIRLLQVKRGDPQNKQLMKIIKDKAHVRTLLNDVESTFMQEKRLHELDEELYYTIDERGNTVNISEKGIDTFSSRGKNIFELPDLSVEVQKIEENEELSAQEKSEKIDELYRTYEGKSEKIHNIQQLLKAYSLFEKDVDYIVQEGKIVIVDQFTGRQMPSRRFSDGLHQALEAKENVAIEQETQTLATITLQNFFRMYDKLAGMTGTAETEEKEFWEIYNLDVVVIPTNDYIRRIDEEDVIYRTMNEKYIAIMDEIERVHRTGRPILVGTVTVDVSEKLSRMLKMRKIPHQVLNARYHEREAEIVTLAGQPTAVTISTNMAGRGTDIKLGKGVVDEECLAIRKKQKQEQNKAKEVIWCCLKCSLKEECKKGDTPLCGKSRQMFECEEDVPCGLHVIGTERHESRRIDRQLRGRSGRQGDPGSSRFYLSLEDDLMRLFGSEKVAGLMTKLNMNMEEGEAIVHPMLTSLIGTAQKRVESSNFSIRKHLLEYDDVMNQQRIVIYDRRLTALEGENLRGMIIESISDIVEQKISPYASPQIYPEEWDLEGLVDEFRRTFLLDLNFIDKENLPDLKYLNLIEQITKGLIEIYTAKEKSFGKELMRHAERIFTLMTIDENWRDHLYAMDRLKEGIGLVAYGQKDPLVEYKQEGFKMFMDMIERIDEQILEKMLKFKPARKEEQISRRRSRVAGITQRHQDATGMAINRAKKTPPQKSESQVTKQEKTKKKRFIPVRHNVKKVGRNDPCPCGSGKKYKHCCGK